MGSAEDQAAPPDPPSTGAPPTNRDPGAPPTHSNLSQPQLGLPWSELLEESRKQTDLLERLLEGQWTATLAAEADRKERQEAGLASAVDTTKAAEGSTKPLGNEAGAGRATEAKKMTEEEMERYVVLAVWRLAEADANARAGSSTHFMTKCVGSSSIQPALTVLQLDHLQERAKTAGCAADLTVAARNVKAEVQNVWRQYSSADPVLASEQELHRKRLSLLADFVKSLLDNAELFKDASQEREEIQWLSSTLGRVASLEDSEASMLAKLRERLSQPLEPLTVEEREELEKLEDLEALDWLEQRNRQELEDRVVVNLYKVLEKLERRRFEELVCLENPVQLGDRRIIRKWVMMKVVLLTYMEIKFRDNCAYGPRMSLVLSAICAILETEPPQPLLGLYESQPHLASMSTCVRLKTVKSLQGLDEAIAAFWAEADDAQKELNNAREALKNIWERTNTDPSWVRGHVLFARLPNMFSGSLGNIKSFTQLVHMS